MLNTYTDLLNAVKGLVRANSQLLFAASAMQGDAHLIDSETTRWQNKLARFKPTIDAADLVIEQITQNRAWQAAYALDRAATESISLAIAAHEFEPCGCELDHEPEWPEKLADLLVQSSAEELIMALSRKILRPPFRSLRDCSYDVLNLSNDVFAESNRIRPSLMKAVANRPLSGYYHKARVEYHRAYAAFIPAQQALEDDINRSKEGPLPKNAASSLYNRAANEIYLRTKELGTTPLREAYEAFLGIELIDEQRQIASSRWRV